MEYAECFWSLAGVRGLGAKNFMRGTPFLDATWDADTSTMAGMLRTFKSELETKGLSPDDTPLNDTDSFGHTPIIAAVYRSHLDAIKWLLSAEVMCNAGAKNVDGWTALHIAVHRQSTAAFVELLRAHERYGELSKLDVNAMNKGCWTPLHFAAYLGQIDMVETLLKFGAIVDSLNSTTQTPLVLACERDHSDVARTLARRGANVFKVSSSGLTPVEFATNHGWDDELQSAARAPEAPPGAPWTSRVKSRSMRVVWSRAEVMWSADVDGYRLDQARLETGKPIRWERVYEGNRDRVNFDASKLRPASWYIFRACCHSWAGWSKYGYASQPTQTGRDKPEPPGLPRLVRDGVTNIRVEWDAGRSNGSPLLCYELQYKLSTFNGLWMTWLNNIPAATDVTLMTVKDLMPRCRYRFRARCRNMIGWSKWGHSAVFATLDAGQIALVSPTATTQWKRGQSIAIQFESTETIKGDVVIELYRGKKRVSEIHNGNRTLPVRFDNNTLTYHGVFTWHVPTIARVGRTYRVKIQSTRYTNVVKQSAEFCIVSDVQGPVDGVHCRKLAASALEKKEAMTEEEMELQREIFLEMTEDRQRELVEEMKVELVARVKQMRRDRAAAERERLEKERDKAFQEKMRRGKATKRLAKH
jgi:hypothetical protein